MKHKFLSPAKAVVTSLGVIALCPPDDINDLLSKTQDDCFLIDHRHKELDFAMEGVIVRSESKAIWMADKIRASSDGEANELVDFVVDLIRSIDPDRLVGATHSLLHTPTVGYEEIQRTSKNALEEIYKRTMTPITRVIVDQTVVEIRRKNGRVNLSAWPLVSRYTHPTPPVLYASPGVLFPNWLTQFHSHKEKIKPHHQRMAHAAVNANIEKFYNFFTMREIPWPKWVTTPTTTA